MNDIRELYRRMRNLPIYIKENGEISSALFRDSKGVSVDIDSNRKVNEIVEDEERLHYYYNADKTKPELENGSYKLKAILSVTKSNCDEKLVCIALDPLKENPYHALLKRSETAITLTGSQCKHLAKNASIVKEYT